MAIFVKIAAVLAGLAIVSGLYFGGPTTRPRNIIILFGLIVLAAFLFTAIDQFHLAP